MALRLKYTENKLKIYNLRNLRYPREKIPRVPREDSVKILGDFHDFLLLLHNNTIFINNNHLNL